MATIEINGKKIGAENGKMIIEVADNAGIYIPRFCYHKKLSIAANCRMCLVEVENGRKPVPACATPITEGMKVYTQSEEALRSQKAVMDFLLINHPLDCPICDQGGECELQDISMGFGQGQSDYQENKRSVHDDNLGSLIATEMTRCIHCTRCVRFGEELAGVRELGGTGRGEDMQIGTYVEHSMVSEVSGNIIDLCPVGALTSKPYRFTARAWEMTQRKGVAPHDCLGSNIYFHTRGGELMRVVPRENERINETWISDRDRFSYLGIHHKDRLLQPMIKKGGQWKVVDWTTALNHAAQGMKQLIDAFGADQFAAFASSNATLEEHYLLQKLMRGMGVSHLDHRLQQTDVSDQWSQTSIPTSTLEYSELDNQQTIILLGCRVNREVPLAAIRVRKAIKKGAKVVAIHTVDEEMFFPLADKQLISPNEWPMMLAQVIVALIAEGRSLPDSAKSLIQGIHSDEVAKRWAQYFLQEKAVVLTGAGVENHPQAALIRALLDLIASMTATKLLQFTTGANAAGAALAGMLPHRGPGGSDIESPGMPIQQALSESLKGYCFLGVEPEFDIAHPSQTMRTLEDAEFVLVLSPFVSERMKTYADVILPIAAFSETSGTYVNIDHRWQKTEGVSNPQGEARPAWKVLRVLANILKLSGFEYSSSEDVLEEIQRVVQRVSPKEKTTYDFSAFSLSTKDELVRFAEWPMVRSDAIVRRSAPLQACAAADTLCIRIHPETVAKLNLNEWVTVSREDNEITLPLISDSRIAPNVVWIPNGFEETTGLASTMGPISVRKATEQ